MNINQAQNSLISSSDLMVVTSHLTVSRNKKDIEIIFEIT